MSFRVQGLDPRQFTHFYDLSDEKLAQVGAQRFEVNAKPGFPDRVEVRDLEIGDTAILLNHEHQPADTPYRSRHAIFVREGAERALDVVDELPEAKGVLFITVEDETGVANIILWPDRFEAQRTVVMSSAMISVTGVVQREGEVIHVIADRIHDRTAMLREVGDIDMPRLTGPGDGATHAGSPDRGDPGWKPKIRSDYHPPFRNG